ncbi:hypothetical protein LIS04_29 [Listeria phage LIS04]|nr:hypothetical protein LIS04_29 [Listeria phage LIS04]
MYLRVGDELGSIQEYYQSSRNCESGDLIKSLVSKGLIKSGEFYRVNFVNSEGVALVDDRLGTQLRANEYLVLVPNKFIWFKKVRYRRVSRTAKTGDLVLTTLANKKYMILRVEYTTESGVLAKSEDFSKQVTHSKYEVLEKAGSVPLNLDPYYLDKRRPQPSNLIQVEGEYDSYGSKYSYPAIHEVIATRDSKVLTKSGEFEIDKCRVLVFTEEKYDKVYRVTVFGKTTGRMVQVPEIVITDLANRVEKLESIIDDFFTRMSASSYYRRDD